MLFDVQAWRPHRLGLQVPLGVGNKVPLPGAWWRCWGSLPRAVAETARAQEMVVHAGSINRDHLYMLLSIPPNLSVSRAVQHSKGRSSHKLLSEFAMLRKRY